MHTLKEKVSNQLSRFFGESQNSSSSSSSSPPPLDPPSSSPDSQAGSFSNGGKSVSSYFPFTVPSLNFGRSRSNKYQEELKPIKSLLVTWGLKGFKPEDEHSVSYHECNTISEDENLQNFSEDSKESIEVSVNKQTDKTLDSNEVSASGRSSSDSDIFEEAREQQTPCSPVLHLMGSTLKHGISLRTLIRKSADLPGPCVLIVGDRQGAVFGGLLECPLKPTPKRKYQGTNQTFVFTTIYGEPRLFRATGANRYYYMCLNDLLALGGGCNFALCLDGDLLNGTSGPCETFGNLCLAHQPEFELKNVELWGFTHSSKFLS
ncbi:nuclear receptor coactivator 7 isoform X2 [Manihot esculenta]|uniref:nuclear receptor coactivator 7 isoform X2 n=1 Tax=Manihot esculenta TaxID=3983 RepID=UPI000B5D83AA|nr:nuclear receptor coactivator 7 isoform X2 [Manihot esculenta]